MFLFRLIKQLTILLGVCIPLQLLGLLIIPAVLLVIKDRPKFPVCLKWFDNADVWNGRDASTYLNTVIPQGFRYRYYWLALRNPINYFGYAVLGITPKTSIKPIYETINTPPVGDTTGAGLYHAEAIIDDIQYYEYYLIYKYPFAQGYCFRFRMGHKLKFLKDLGIGTPIQWVMVISPFHSYTGV